MRSGRIATFYSYKGGVGRSMAVANVAALLAQRRRRVLVIDFDLEAPGLHRYFSVPADTRPSGVIDLFLSLNDALDKTFPTDEEYCRDRAFTQEEISRLLRDRLDSGDYTSRIPIKNPNPPRHSASLDFIAAGRFDDGYAARVRNFDWAGFYQRYQEVFPLLVAEWKRRYEYVLIDSRTGITDTASVCTAVLPDALVLVFSSNRQSMHGAFEVGRQAAMESGRLAKPKILPLFPLLSRLENSEEQLKLRWVNDAKNAFSRLIHDLSGEEERDFTAYFEKVRIPYSSYYSFGEEISAEHQPALQTGSLSSGFRLFTRCLDCDSPEAAQEALLADAPEDLYLRAQAELEEANRGRVVVLSNLLLGLCPLRPEILELLNDLARTPAAEVVLAGGVLFPPDVASIESPAGDSLPRAWIEEGLAAIGRVAGAGNRVTMLLAPDELEWREMYPWGSKVRSGEEVPRMVVGTIAEGALEQIGDRKNIPPGTRGHRIDLAGRSVWIMTSPSADPLAGLDLDDLLTPLLSGFLRNWRRLPVPPPGLTSSFVSCLARVVNAAAAPQAALAELDEFLERNIASRKGRLHQDVISASIWCMAESVTPGRQHEDLDSADRFLRELYRQTPDLPLGPFAAEWLKAHITVQARSVRDLVARRAFLTAGATKAVIFGLAAAALEPSRDLGPAVASTGSAANGQWIEVMATHRPSLWLVGPGGRRPLFLDE